MSDTISDKTAPELPRGWMCPRCGKGVAPYITVCPCVADVSVKPKSIWNDEKHTAAVGTYLRPIWMSEHKDEDVANFKEFSMADGGNDSILSPKSMHSVLFPNVPEERSP